ncbi:MAG TPA: DUF1254 domain-containing protein [Candidatus Angelobacter sp.]|nr:DUF1254 domain-containing protein [Candidatus Angelobacter sp.]
MNDLRRRLALRFASCWLVVFAATSLSSVAIARQGAGASAPTNAELTNDEARKLGGEAYAFAYPLVVMEMTRRTATMGDVPRFINRFNHARAFPDDHFRGVIRPNADTLYSSAWLDLSKGPVFLHVPDTKGRYYLFQLMDAWSETISVPGKRTTGTGEKWFAIIGPGWKGTLPSDVERLDCPTNTAWLLGRTQTNNASEYDFVHGLQAGYELSLGAKEPALPPLQPRDLAVIWRPNGPPRSTDAPPEQVAKLSVSKFFELFAQLLLQNPAHSEDDAIMRELAKVGIVAGSPFPSDKSDKTGKNDKLSPELLQAFEEGADKAASSLGHFDPEKMPVGKTGWSKPGKYGRYGTNYVSRALIARHFLGALPAEDAVYLSSFHTPGFHDPSSHDQRVEPFQGSKRYVMHFEKGAIPPVKAFWSLTLYDDQGYFTANSLNRFAIGDRDSLKINPDGSLDLYLQHDSPGAEKESNWLPAPSAGFNLVLRMYWPEDSIIDGKWLPPAVTAVQ